MSDTSLLAKGFADLMAQVITIEGTKKPGTGMYPNLHTVDDTLLLNWRVKARNLIVKACGKDSEHYITFEKYENPRGMTKSHGMMQNLKAVFLAAKEDYEGGYLNSVRSLIHAEVFDSELEQASELLTTGYKIPAAVIAGIVLETTLRQMCDDRKMVIGKMDKMNADLTKVGAYNLLIQKKITALADIRNSAAHSHSENFTDTDVADMISQIRDFLSKQL